jgi:phosphoribosylformimino-5-aminoimidazole carboxamide ribotide isomerase
VLIPSIDLMGCKIVQLVQGEKKALEFENFSEWVGRFRNYRVVQLIDLDAAMSKGSNRDLVADFCAQLSCQVGGGIRTVESASEVLSCGAKRIIVGSSLVKDGEIDLGFASKLAGTIGQKHIVCAIDSRGGRVAIHGWKAITDIRPEEMIRALEPYCSAFLYTHIDTEGLLQGIPLELIQKLRTLTSRQFIAAGGIHSQEEIDALHAMDVDAVVGMAIYSGLIQV